MQNLQRANEDMEKQMKALEEMIRNLEKKTEEKKQDEKNMIKDILAPPHQDPN
jgi:hypothetical protein